MSDVGYNIGHLISESSFQTLDSPWTSPKHFYSLTESDHGSTSSRRFLQNGHNDDGYGHQDMPADSFRPAIVPIITSEKRTSSLTSLLKTDAWSSPSMRNNEKRRQQYGDHDSSDSENGIAYPAIGENSLNMAVVMSSGRRKSTGTDEDGSRDKIGGTNVRERRVNREERRDGGRGLGFNEEHDDDSDNSDELYRLTDAKAEKFIGTLGDSSYEEALLISSQNNVKNDRRNDGYHPDDAEEMQAQEAMFGCILEAQSRHMAHRRSVAMAIQTPAGSQLTKNQDAFNRENSHSPVIHHNQSSQAFNLAVSTSLSAVLGSGSMSGTGSVPVSRLTSGSGSGSVSGIFNSALAASGIGIGLGSGSGSGSGTVSSYRTSATPSQSSSQKDIEESSVRDYQATEIKDPRSRGKGKREVPLVSAMRNKKASSTEIAMAR